MNGLPPIPDSPSKKRNFSRNREREDESIADFASNSTTHGISYVFEKDVHYWSRLVWLFTVLGLFTLAIVMITSLYGNWKASPITTTIEDPAVPINEIDFPAITLCGLGTASGLARITYGKQIRDYLMSQGIDVSSIDEDAFADDYFEAFGYEYEQELYGDLALDPYFLAQLLAAREPDAFMKKKVTSGPPLCSPESITSKCLEDSVYDEKANICYKEVTGQVTAAKASELCGQNLMEAFTPNSDDQLMNLANLIKKGMLANIIEDVTFWASTRKRQSGQFTLNDGNELNATSFSTLDITRSNIAKDRCLSLHYSGSKKMFIGKEVSCSSMNHVLCFSLPLEESLCEFNQNMPQGNTGGQPHGGPPSDSGSAGNGQTQGGQSGQGQPNSEGWTSEGGQRGKRDLSHHKGRKESSSSGQSGQGSNTNQGGPPSNSGGDQGSSSTGQSGQGSNTNQGGPPSNSGGQQGSSGQESNMNQGSSPSNSGNQQGQSGQGGQGGNTNQQGTPPTGGSGQLGGGQPGNAGNGGASSKSFAGELLSKFLDQSQRLELYQLLQAEFHGTKGSFKAIDWVKSYKHFFELLWSLKLPCFDTNIISDYPNHRSMLKMCIWKGTKLPCSSLFTTFPTESGMCCTFNLQKADKMLRASKFVETINELQARDNVESFEDTSLPMWYTSNKEPYPKQGVKNGLTVLIDAHTDQLQEASVTEDFQGFSAAITHSTTYPFVNLNSIAIKPGHENYVAITATDVVASNSFKTSLSKDERKCYYPDEKVLNTYNQYSFPGCVLECQMKHAKIGASGHNRSQECYPWFLPHAENNTRVCDPWETRNFLTEMNNVPDECRSCLVDCEFTQYTTSVTTVPFRKCDNKNLGVTRLCNVENAFGPNPGIFGAQLYEEYANSLPSYASHFVSSQRELVKKPSEEVFSEAFDNDEVNSYDAYEKDIAMVSFYFESPQAVRYTRQPTMTGVQFLSQIGGLLGLCIGFSFCSLVEIFYWFGIRLWWSPKFKKD